MKIITRLSDDVIARIAAGEVITSPYNIVKELIENSIDANCSIITIDIQTTLSSLVIIDDGDGIDRKDFDKLCIRHYTSKFTGDMLTINTFGFRGEALSSISLSSKITVE
ncbi:hypothetical protein COBT_003094, partial [Conglomerata obtusa]